MLNITAVKYIIYVWVETLAAIWPDYDYIYLGDNARAPYGNHSQKIVKKYTKQAVSHLYDMGCDLIILGCNTASVDALRRIQKKHPWWIENDRSYWDSTQ